MNNLDPELLRQILAAGIGGNTNGYGLGVGNYTGPQITEANDPSASLANYEQVIYGNGQKPSWATNTWDTWNLDGTYRGEGSGDSNAMSALKFAALAAAGYGLGTGIESLGSAGTGAASGAGAAGGVDAGITSMAAAPTSTSVSSLGAIPATGGAAGATGAAASSPAWIEAAKTVAKGAGLNWGSLLGAAAGALDGKDKQSTTSRDPWAPAQPALMGLLSQGQELMTRPAVSPEMQAAYNNAAALLANANAAAPGLLASAQANASGANNYSRLGRGLLGKVGP